MSAWSLLSCADPSHVASLRLRRRPARTARNDGKHDVGRVLRVVVDDLIGLSHSGAGRRILAGVEISIETGKIAAGDLDPNSMARQKCITGCPQVDRVFVRLSCLYRARRSTRRPVTCPYDAVLNV